MSFFSNLQQYVSNSVANFSPKRFSLSGRGDSVPGASHPHTGSGLTAASTGSFDDQQGPINVSTVLPGMQMTNQSIRTGTVSSSFEVGSTSSSRPLGPKAVPPILNERSKSLRVVSFHAAADPNCPLTPSSQRRTNSTSRASSWKELPMPRDLLPHEKNAAKGAGGLKLKNSLDQDLLYWKLRPSFCVQGSGELRRTSWPQFAITGSGVQEADGSFFESFTALGWKQENRRLQALREEEQDRTAACNMTASGDYSTAITPLPPLSQQHPTITPKELEQLYVEVLYTVRHKIGAHSAQYPHHYQEDLFQYAQSAFNMTAEDHRRCLAIASEEKPPIVVLNVVVIEAEGLEAKDPNGYSDPYCMLGIQPGNATTSTTPCLSTSSRETPPESPLPCGGGSAPKSDDDTFLVPEDRPMLTSERRGSLVSVPQLEKLKKHHSFRLSFKRKEPTHNRKDREQRDSLNSALPAKFIRATSVKPQTLNPKWIEKFRFDIDDVTSDILHLDIWDHDDEYSVLDAVSKLNEVRGVKGLGRFFKQIAQSARSGNQDDFLGCVNIPIQDIPSTGMECWYKLEGRSQRSTIQGRIRLKLFLSTREDFGTSEEDNWTELKQQEQLHSIFMDYELSRQKGGASQWAGDLPPLGQTILHQHAIQGDVTILQSAVVRWIAYARKLLSQPLHYSLLHSLLQDLDAKWSKESLSREEEEALAESFNMFVEHSLTLLRKVRQVFSPSNKSTVGRLEHLLKCLVYLSNMKAFWKCCPFNKEIRGEIITAVRKGTLEWYSEQFHKWTELPIISALTLAQSRDTLIQGLIHLTNALCVDFQWALQIYDPLFQKIAGVPYFLIVYKQIDKMVGQDFGPRIEELCRNLAMEDMADNGDPNRMTIGTPIFELYVALQDLLKFQEHVPVEDRRSLQPAQYHEWFTLAVNRWLAVAYNKAYYRIQKALELDAMTNVEPYMKMTTSAIDTTSCFYQVREFWKQLAWPDPFTAYPLLYKIVEIIAVGASQYAESVHARLLQAGFYDEGKLTPFSEEVFMALNNLEHVRHALETLPEDLLLEQVLAVVEMTVNGYPMNSNSYANLGTDMRKLSVGNMSRSSPSVGNVGITYDTGARQALLSLLEGSLRECDTKTLRILGEITEKARPELKKSVFHLAWSPDSLPAEEAIAPLLNTLDLHLTALHTNLLQAAFHKALLALWEVIILELWAQAETSTSEKLNIFFERLHKSLEILLDFLHADGKGLPVESLRTVTYTRVSEMIAFHKTTTEQLIRLYYMERLEDQQRVEMVEFGVLSVRCYFNHDSLCVEVLSARDVIPLDPNGFSDPFVIVELLPRRVFAHCSEQQTTVQKKTLNPLFDECFEFPVTLEQCRAEGAMILFTVMDYDVLTANDFAGEAFLSLNSIPGVAGNASADNFHGLKPVDLILMHQKQKNHPILSVLETRTWDKPAQEFVKKQKERCGA